MIDYLKELFSGLLALPWGKEVFVFFVSMLPLIELRGGVPVAIALGIPPLKALLICTIGNIVPAPFILWFITAIFAFMKKHNILAKLIERIEEKGHKNKEKIAKYEFWGLLLFTSLPLPATGAWMGSLAAVLLNMDRKKAFFTIAAGVTVCGLIMLVTSLLVKGALV